MRAYLLILVAALSCYAALGAVLRVLGELDLDPAALGLAAGAPALTGVALRPLGGRLSDRHGPRPVMAAGAAVMTLAAPVAFLPGTICLIASRLAVGAGEGLMMSAGVAWLLALAGPERRGRALGHIGLANYGGLTLGPLLAQAVGVAERPVLAAATVLPVAAVVAARALPGPAPADDGHGKQAPALATVARAALRPGTGLLLVNVGYAALIAFATPAARRHGVDAATVVVPAFAVTVVLARTAGGAIPDRAGPRRTLAVCAPAAAAGLAVVGVATSAPVLLAGVVALAGGQALAVPALGLLVLAGVPESARGAAAGAFFAFFDLGVGLGSPALGLLARAAGPPAALLAAAGAVLAVALVSPATRAPTRRSGAPA